MTEMEKHHDYGNLGTVFQSLGEYVKARNILRKHLRSQLKLVTEQEKHHVTET